MADTVKVKLNHTGEDADVSEAEAVHLRRLGFVTDLPGKVEDPNPDAVTAAAQAAASTPKGK